ncbi:hypothetical protein [Leucobacter tenebrionis]|uniref:hypothetical protein n=1 Tax=Leucobacter tenebrionis TaxID=2873270 RepID=UPI001CA78C0A|nr:hypothetical protein [Leucobacter tenebrionis]QZY51943.1 hypothetical protein KVY00_00130 [Leucobacter tenebrionis]
MDTTVSPPNTVNARTLLLPYALTLVVAMGIVQAVIALTGGRITLLAIILTAVVALGIVVWLLANYRALTRVRFGVAVAHALAFVTVTTSFNAHAALRAFILGSGPEGFETVSRDLLATPWFGATLVMSAAWGIGLLIHLVGVVLGRGWED